jgi:hypothetical protein
MTRSYLWERVTSRAPDSFTRRVGDQTAPRSRFIGLADQRLRSWWSRDLAHTVPNMLLLSHSICWRLMYCNLVNLVERSCQDLPTNLQLIRTGRMPEFSSQLPREDRRPVDRRLAVPRRSSARRTALPHVHALDESHEPIVLVADRKPQRSRTSRSLRTPGGLRASVMLRRAVVSDLPRDTALASVGDGESTELRGRRQGAQGFPVRSTTNTWGRRSHVSVDRSSALSRRSSTNAAERTTSELITVARRIPCTHAGNRSSRVPCSRSCL